jgi:hypothetical protein
MRQGFVAMAGALAVLAAGAAEARIVSLKVDREESFAEGKSFGEAGPYLRILGTAKGELDPGEAVNQGIADLEKAPRNSAGRVEYEVEFYIMRPADPAKGNGKILYEVTNRGRKLLLPYLHDVAPAAGGAVNDPATAAHAGNRFAFERGYTIVWSGWDPDVPRANNGLSIRVPVATEGGEPIIERIRDEFVFGTRIPESSPTAPLSYDAATLDQSEARLTVRARETDQPEEVPASDWTYSGTKAIKLLPEGAKFKPGWIYEFRYRAKDPKVVGIGYAATRDLVSFLRYEKEAGGTGNPVGRPISHAIALGISQSGRYLRDHIAHGFNQDEAWRKVFDGTLAHISGVGRVFANARFGQPNRTNTQHEDHLFPENEFPFAHGATTDPATGRTAALLRGDGFDPLVIESNTSTEYWQKGASLLATDPLGKEDLTIPSTVRLYMVAGTQHGGRANLDASPGNCANPRNPHSPAPALRALVVALDAWVSEGTAPPESRIPTLAGGTLVLPEESRFPPLPGVAVARRGNPVQMFGDWRDPHPDPARNYVAKVARVDADGNETAGILLPDIAAPLGTFTGWNLYKAPYPEGELCDRDGTYIPFAKTRAERETRGDPRPSLEERYGTRDAYAAKIAEAAEALVKARFLLPEDAARYVAEAKSTSAF